MVEFVIVNVLLAASVGTAASYLFYLWLSQQTPRVEVSPQIAQARHPVNGSIQHKVKVLNRTQVPIVDIKATLHLVTPTEHGYIRTKRIELKSDAPLAIAAFDRNDETAGYAYRFVAYDLDEQIRDEDADVTKCRLRFRIVCRHSFSNFGAFVQRDYSFKDVLRGDFRLGDTFEIVSPNNIPQAEDVKGPVVRDVGGCQRLAETL